MKTEASALVLKNTTPYMIAPTIHVIIMITTFPGQPLNSMNWKIIHVMLPPVSKMNKVIKVMPAQLPAWPPYLSTLLTRLELITKATISISIPW